MSTDHPESPTAVSTRLAGLGPYFAAEFHDAATAPHEPWRPLSDLVEEPLLDARITAVRTHLAAGRPPDSVEVRTAASVFHLGVAARLTAPLFALALSGHTAALTIGDLRWQPTAGSMFPLSLPERLLDTAVPGTPATAMVLGPIADLSAPLAARGVNPHILRGNAASALGGAVNALAATRPGLVPAARALLLSLLASPVLRGSATVRPTGRLRRASCCLIYRAAPDRRGPLCGDCALAAP